jgi:threonine synthase
MLPILPDAPPVTLGEGATGLHETPRLARWAGVDDLRVKHEGENPTGSFKDRGMTAGVTLARAFGYDVVGCASTGNTSASLAAYAARAGLPAVVLVPAGKVARGKMAQAIAHGARVVAVEGNFDRALEIVDELADRGQVYLLNSVNPLRLEGQKTITWEVLDQLDDPPDRVVFPVGNAGNLSAAHKALQEWQEAGLVDDRPALTGVQAEGSAPFVDLFRGGGDELEPDPDPETRATAIRIGHPVNWPKARRAVEATGGTAVAVGDDEILEAQHVMASEEGVFAEPASAASVAGLRRLVDAGEVEADEDVVCVATGHGLKDPDAPLDGPAPDPVEVPATLEAVQGALP